MSTPDQPITMTGGDVIDAVKRGGTLLVFCGARFRRPQLSQGRLTVSNDGRGVQTIRRDDVLLVSRGS